MSKIAFNIRDIYFQDHSGAASFNKPTDLIDSLLPNVYTIASILLLIYLVVGGVMVVVSAGSDDTHTGKQIITNAIIGFVIVFASYWIIQIIQVITGINILG